MKPNVVRRGDPVTVVLRGSCVVVRAKVVKTVNGHVYVKYEVLPRSNDRLGGTYTERYSVRRNREGVEWIRGWHEGHEIDELLGAHLAAQALR